MVFQNECSYLSFHRRGAIGEVFTGFKGIICTDRAWIVSIARGREEDRRRLSSTIFHFARPAGCPFLLACLPREITGCFDGPILQLRGSAPGFHFSGKVNLILNARIVCLFRSVCALALACAVDTVRTCEYIIRVRPVPFTFVPDRI